VASRIRLCWRYDNAYNSILQKIAQSKTTISLFHAYLREQYGAPYSSVANSNIRSPIKCRTTLITPAQMKSTFFHLNKIPSGDAQILQHTKTYTSIGYNFGVRSKEAFGLSKNHVIANNPFRLLITRNGIRDLKTKKYSLRAVTSVPLGREYKSHLSSIIEFSNIAPVSNEPLFSDTENKHQLYPNWRISKAVTSVLRFTTQNLSVVPYTMRHSFATRLAHSVFISPNCNSLGYTEAITSRCIIG
jgi:integrase